MRNADEKDTQDTGEFLALDRQVSKFYEAEPRVRMRAEVAGKSHPGLVRPNNEDNYLVVRRYRGREILATSLPEGLLDVTEDHAYTLAVADGMGGRNFGELASLLAMRTGWELGGDEIKWTVRLNEQEVEELRQKAQVFCRLIDESLQAEIRENPRLSGMGTTMTLCYSTGPNLFTIHVGDSRAYLHRGGKLRLLTHDHNVGQILIDTGRAEPDSPEVRRMSHVLTNCLGGPEGVKADVDHYPLEDGDCVLLCTDGLNDMVKDEEVAVLLGRNPSPPDACNALVALALERGGKDNVTVVVARYHLDEPRSSAGEAAWVPS
jgi:PPM family protein phosphatase